jgi:histidine triad (HIT) family protein
MDCPFCDNELLRGRILEETDSCFVILSNPRLTPGHTLVIPKRHVEKLSELTSEEHSSLLDKVIEYQEKIVSKLASGCDIRQNYRPFLPQGKIKVNHIHFHLLPREFEDNYYHKCQKYEKDLWEDLSKKEEQKFSELLC